MGSVAQARGRLCGGHLGLPRTTRGTSSTPWGSTGRFGAVVTAEDVVRGKPDPEVYVRAAGAIGVAPRACLVFEDAVVGVQAAREAGMRVIGVTTAHSGDELSAAGAERAIADFDGADVADVSQGTRGLTRSERDGVRLRLRFVSVSTNDRQEA